MSRLKGPAVKNIGIDIDIAFIFDSEISVNIDSGTGDIDPALTHIVIHASDRWCRYLKSVSAIRYFLKSVRYRDRYRYTVFFTFVLF